jgi:DNA repair exonuclease SbcCD nuclease subunit
MLKILHISDLHLSAGEGKEYGLSVLREVVSLANSKQADFLLVAGDLFDSFNEIKDNSLLNAVKAEAEKLGKTCRALYIPGNHEFLGQGPRDKLSNFNFGRIELMTDAASAFGGKFLETAEAEFVCVPHGADFSGYRKWVVPAKTAGRARVLLMHGTNSAVYCGPDPEEAKAGIIPDSLFAGLDADYAALGHVHSGRATQMGGALAVYCGSARVWRRGEEGPRRAVFFKIENGRVSGKEDLVLRSAGEYKLFSLPVDPDASVPRFALAELLKNCESPEMDHIEIRFTGFVEDANALEGTKKMLETALGAKKPRKLEIMEKDVNSYGGLASNGLAKQFLAKLEAQKPPPGSPETAVWLAARRQGLAVLVNKDLD